MSDDKISVEGLEKLFKKLKPGMNDHWKQTIENHWKVENLELLISCLNYEEERQEEKSKWQKEELKRNEEELKRLVLENEVKGIIIEIMNKRVFRTEREFEVLEKFEDMFFGLEDTGLTNSCKRKLEKILFTPKFENEQEIQLYCSTIMKTLENDSDLRRNHIAVYTQSNTSSKQDRKADILFHEYESSNFNAAGHAGWCAQKNALFPIKLKKKIYNSNNTLNSSFTKAVGEIQWATFLSKNCQARFGLIGDGINWVFTETCVVGTQSKIFKYGEKTVDYKTFKKFLKTLKNILLIKQNKAKLLPLSKIYTIGEYISEKNFIFVSPACGIIEFTKKSDKKEKTVFKFVIDRKNPLQEKEYTQLQFFEENELEKCDKLVPFLDCGLQLHKMNVFQMPFYKNCSSLQDFCLCNSERGDEIFEIVKRDVSKALDFLHDKELAFVDLHPGNILLIEEEGQTHAKLCDFESIRYFNTNFGKNPSCTLCSETEEIACFLHSKPPSRKHFVTATEFNAESDYKSFSLLLEWIKERSIT